MMVPIPALPLPDDHQPAMVEFDYEGERVELAYVAQPGVGVMLLDWNFTQDGGERVPLTLATLLEFPVTLLVGILEAIANDSREGGA